MVDVAELIGLNYMSRPLSGNVVRQLADIKHKLVFLQITVILY